MNKQRKTSHILNVFQYDADGHVVIPATLTIGENPHSSDNTNKIPSTAWVRTYVSGLSYQGAITLTNTGSSGAASLLSNTLNIPTYTLAGLGGEPAITAGTTAQYWRGDKSFQTLNTTVVSEGTNLYYTDARVGSYLTANNYATQSYVGTQIANLVDAAPGTLDTLNELAAALGDDPNFATTVSTSIGTKVPQARTITINGTSYDLTANRSWTINSMVYPSAGIALSTGTAWGTSITDNSANWNTAFGWGNHASAGYLTSLPSHNHDGVYMKTNRTLDTINTIDNGGDRYNPSVNNPTNEHYAVLTYGNGGNVTGQLATHFVSGQLYSRGYNSSWSTWLKYVVENGGTWGISVTGSAGSVAWTNVAGRPTTLSSFTNDSGYITQSTGDGRYLMGTTNPGSVNNFTISIGNNGSYSYVQSHSGQPLELNPVGNTVRIAGNIVWHQGNLTNLNQLSNGPGYITSSSLGSYLPLSGGTMTGKILTPSSADGTYGGAIEIRERGYVSNSQSDWSYSPAITFHWGNRAALRFGLRSDGLMAVDQNPIVIQNGGTWSINVTGTANSETLSTVTGRGASTSSQVSFTKTDDHAISVGTIRGRAVGSQTGEFIQLYERVNIGGPSGWGAANTAAPTYGLSVYGGANIGYGNSASLFAYSYRGNSNVAGTGEASYHPAGVYSTGTNWLYGTMYLNNNTIHDAANIYNSGWYRNYGQTGLYNQSYDNHIASYDSTYWRIASANGIQIYDKGIVNLKGYIYFDSSSFGLLNSSGQWAVRTYGSSETQLMWNGSWRGIAQSNGFRVNGNIYTDVDYGYGLVGVYTSTRYQGVFAMGDAYKLPADGTSTGSLYGLAWSHPNAGGIAGNLNDHGLLVLINGGFAAAVSSSIRAASDMRAPIFYDQNDTGYYLDLNSTSNSAMRIRGGALFGPNPTWGAYLSVGTNGHASASYASVAATNGNLHLDGASGCHMYLNYYVNGIIYLNGSTYSISSNGSYYNGTSSYSNNSGALNGWGYGSYAYRSSGSGYYQIDTWLQINGTHGIYWPSYYGAHLYVNTGSSYTQFRLDGQKNGYGGIWDSYSAVAGIMYDGGGNGGVYREANSRWYWYYHLGNACMGINTSTTSSSYAAYVNGNLYATGDITAYSDRRKKTDITTIDNALDKVTKIRGVYYNKIDDLEKGRQTGVIAQEINEVLPEVVTYAADVDEYGVKYGNIVGVLIEAIKEQQKQIEELQNKLDNVLSSR